MSRPIWRSLAARDGDPEVRLFREGEFPPGADLPPDPVSRREMMTLLGGTLAMAGLSGCRRPEEHIVPYAEAPETVVPGVPRAYATTMPAGTSAYGLVVESHEGRPTKIEGNELHPASLGSTSGRMQAAMLDLYDPDRSAHVLKKGEKASWSDFVAAWKELAKTADADQGASLAVVSAPFASPTLARLRGTFLTRYPRARWIAHTAIGDENAREGLQQAAGKAVLPVHHLDKARVVLALDADLLLTDPENVRHTRGFAASRRLASEKDEMSRLWVVEGLYSVTGANADERLRLSTRLVPAFLAALLAELRRQGVGLPAPDAPLPTGVREAFVKALAADLLAHRGASVVAAGPRQPASVHAAVHALNAALGNVGITVEYREPADALLPARGELGALVKSLGAGEIKTLVLLGVNPAYDAPGDVGFAAAAPKATEIVHVGAQVDETAALATWHVPAAHFLEAWGDAWSVDGTLSVIQPLILPLLGGKSPVEMAALLATGEEKSGYDAVRETWQARLGALGFEIRWNRVLHDGLLADPPPAPPAPPANVLPAKVTAPGRSVPAAPAGAPLGAIMAGLLADAQARAGQGALEIVFAPCPKLHDGGNANNTWLQELPDPLTKVVWNNPALMSPATASQSGLAKDGKDGDVVRVEVGGKAVELPVFRVPGMADGTVVLTLGYGRRAAGRAGTGVGVDVTPVRSATSDLAAGTVTAAGRRVALAQTQEHGDMDGRPIVHQASLDEYRAKPDFVHEANHHPELFSLWDEHTYDAGHQWGMAIDLAACTGCNACAVACQSENNIPVVGPDQVSRGREMAWIRVDRYFTGEPADAGVAFQPVPCMQCENAPCEQVCPVAATVHDHEGLNVMVYNRCIGTRYCSNNCPYKVRRFNFFNFTKDTPEIVKMAMNPDVTVRSRGVMEKCSYCVQRLNRGKIEAKMGGRELKDGDVKTACQQACPAQAISFGNLREKDAAVVKAKSGNRNYALLAELNSKPRTTYLAKVSNPHPDLAPAPAKAEHHG